MTRLVWLAITALITIVTANRIWADDPANARRPQGDTELRYWPENMIWHHRFSTGEITGGRASEGAARLQDSQVIGSSRELA